MVDVYCLHCIVTPKTKKSYQNYLRYEQNTSEASVSQMKTKNTHPRPTMRVEEVTFQYKVLFKCSGLTSYTVIFLSMPAVTSLVVDRLPRCSFGRELMPYSVSKGEEYTNWGRDGVC
jgi:hypothetical protein